MPADRTTEVLPPVLQVTRYDRVAAAAIAIFAAIVVAFGGVTAVWVSSRPAGKLVAVPVEIVELPGGSEDGSPDETLRVDSPDPERPDASPAEEMADKAEVEQTLETVVEMSDAATEMVQQQFDTGVQNTGKAGSASGTGRRALGSGPGVAGFPREERWYVRFGDRLTVDEYAKQLEFFGIELGALLPDGRLAYLANPSQKPPMLRYTNSGADEKRLYMSWQGGERRNADLDLFARAGLTVPAGATILHFYSADAENQLARLELDYRNRKVQQIRRTYFSVEKDGAGFKFVVTKQVAAIARSSR